MTTLESAVQSLLDQLMADGLTMRDCQPEYENEVRRGAPFTLEIEGGLCTFNATIDRRYRQRNGTLKVWFRDGSIVLEPDDVTEIEYHRDVSSVNVDQGPPIFGAGKWKVQRADEEGLT